MLRALKQYVLPFSHAPTPTQRITMSSYFGALSSIDDYYVTDTYAHSQPSLSVANDACLLLVNEQTTQYERYAD